MEIGSFSAFKVAASEKVDPGQTWTDELHHNGLKIILKGQEISDHVFLAYKSSKTNKTLPLKEQLNQTNSQWVPGCSGQMEMVVIIPKTEREFRISGLKCLRFSSIETFRI